MPTKRLLVTLGVSLTLALIFGGSLTVLSPQTYAQTGACPAGACATKKEVITDWNRPAIPPASIEAASVGNGNFEGGADGTWTEYSALGYPLILPLTMLPTWITPHSGNWVAWLGGDNNETASISQTVVITAETSTLNFWMWIDSNEIAGCVYDFGRVLINGTEVYSFPLCDATNTNGWVNRTVNLNAYIGQNVELQFRAETDVSGSSSLFIDDVTLGQQSYVYLPVINKNACGFYYFDDFSNPNSGWSVENNSDYVMGYLGGEYQILLNNPWWWAFGLPDLDLPGKYRLEVDVHKTSTYEGAYGMLFGIGWGNNSFETYQFLVEPQTQKYLLDKRSMNGSWNALIGWSDAGIINSGTATNHLRVDRIGSAIHLYINNVWVNTAYDSSFISPGRDVALYVDSYDQAPLDVRFDNFRADCLP